MRRIHWPSLISGAAVGFAAFYLHTTGSLRTEVRQMQRRIAAVDSRMAQLVNASDHAEHASDLLGVLMAQGERVDAAREALDAMSDLQRAVTISAQQTDEAQLVANRWHELAEKLIVDQRQQTQSFEAITEIDALQQDVAALGASAKAAQQDMVASRTALTDLANLQLQVAATAEATTPARAAIAGIDELQAHLLAAAERTDIARQSANGLVALQQTLSSLEDPATAQATADQLIALQTSLASDARLNLVAAEQNAESLLKMQESLSGQTGRIIASIENLELLTDFQDELTSQLGQVEALRRQLTELMLLETTVSRTMTALAPLADLGNLRRLDDSQVREVARTMLDRRHERLATAQSKYDSATPTPAKSIDTDRLVPEPPAE